MSRNRIIYQSQGLFISPSSTGYHMQTGNASNAHSLDSWGNTNWSGVTGISFPDGAAGGVINGVVLNRSLIEPLHRIQSVNFSFNINRQDINEFGQLARIDSIVMDAPTVSLDFNYYLTDGGNERKMGFNVPTNGSGIGSHNGRSSATQYGWTGDGAISGYSALSGLIEDRQGNNYFIVTTKEGEDLQGDTVTSSSDDFQVISVGNGFVSNYSMEASVGSVPTASVSVEAFNIRSDDKISGALDGTPPSAVTGNQIPAVDDTNGQKVEINYEFRGGAISSTGDYTQGQTVAADAITALRPGDILLEFLDDDGTAFTQSTYDGFVDLDGEGKAHIQSFSVSIPMSRTVLGRLGNTFGYSRVIDLPLNVDVSISAIVSELVDNNLFDKLCDTSRKNFRLTLRRACTASSGVSGADAMVLDIKGARLEGESYSNSLGDNETVDITFSCQVGGAQDQNNGVFIRGSYPRWSTLPYWPMGEKKSDASSYIGDPTAP